MTAARTKAPKPADDDPSPAPPPTITERRQALEARIATLRGQRGATLLDGAPFDDVALGLLQRQLDAIADAEDEQHKRDAEVAAQAEGARIAALRGALTASNDRRLVSLDAAETAAKRMVGHLAEFFTASASVVDDARHLGPSPHTLMRPDLERRVSLLLTQALSPILSVPRQFGGIDDLPSCAAAYAGPWVDVEHRHTDAEISPLTKESTQ
jgi:hypothetical protein